MTDETKAAGEITEWRCVTLRRLDDGEECVLSVGEHSAEMEPVGLWVCREHPWDPYNRPSLCRKLTNSGICGLAAHRLAWADARPKPSPEAVEALCERLEAASASSHRRNCHREDRESCRYSPCSADRAAIAAVRDGRRG